MSLLGLAPHRIFHSLLIPLLDRKAYQKLADFFYKGSISILDLVDHTVSSTSIQLWLWREKASTDSTTQKHMCVAVSTKRFYRNKQLAGFGL